MNIKGLQKTTLLDFPGKIACTIFVDGCNFRCRYCHNSSLLAVSNIQSDSTITTDDFFSFLLSRKHKLQGVCISGGEPTLQADLVPFIKQIKSLGFLVKLDTNGYQPRVLQELIDANLLDYIAMDLKTSLDSYEDLIQMPSFCSNTIVTSISLIKNSGVDYEFRSTIVKELHDSNIIQKMVELIAPANAYYLQNYVDSDNVLEKGFHSYTREELLTFRSEERRVGKEC